jgi:hypothetical protein
MKKYEEMRLSVIDRATEPLQDVHEYASLKHLPECGESSLEHIASD